MQLKLVICIVGLTLCANALGWEPTQAFAKKLTIEYELFPPFGNTKVEITVGDEGYIEFLSIVTEARVTEIPPEKLSSIKYPSLADIEVMHFGEKDEESGLGGSFSLCIPYGRIERVKNETYWQRPVLAILFTGSEDRVTDVPHPNGGSLHGEINGCEVSAQDVYGF